MADLKVVQRTPEPANLRAPEKTIADYKIITPEDFKNLDRQDYAVPLHQRLSDRPRTRDARSIRFMHES